MNMTPIKLSLIAGIVSSLVFAPIALAGNNGHGNHHKKSSYSKHSNHQKYSNHKKKHRKSHHKAKHIIGGIIGGVVLSNIFHNKHHNVSSHVSYNQPRYRHTYYNQHNGYNQHGRYNQPVVVNKTIVVNNTPTQTYRVLNGSDCYLVNVNNIGSEILTQVPNVNCGF